MADCNRPGLCLLPALQIAGHVLKQHRYRDSEEENAAARELDIRELQDK